MRAIALAAITVVSCRNDPDTATETAAATGTVTETDTVTETVTEPTANAAPAATQRHVRLELDGREVARLAASELDTPRPVASLLPAELQPLGDPARWFLVQLSGGRRRLDLQKPAERYPGQELRIHRAADGRIRGALHGPGGETIGLSDIDRVAIHTAPAEETAPPASLLVRAPGARGVTLSAAELERLPAAGSRERQWRLLDIAALAPAVDAARVARITVVSAEGERARFDRAALTHRERAPVLRLNRRGTLRLDRLGGGEHGGGGGGGGGGGDHAGQGPGSGGDGTDMIRAAVRLEVELTGAEAKP